MQNNHNPRIEIFEKMPVPKAVASLVLPTIAGMLVTVVYNMVDTFFVGQTGDPNQVAAVSLTMPIFMLLMAFSNIFGIGGSTFISRLLGEKKLDQVKRISAFCFYACIMLGLVMMALFLGGMKGILAVSGASDQTYGFARDYLTYIAYGAPFVCVSLALGHIIRAEGSPKISMYGMMIGTVVNIILDPIMILWMNLGVAGAAIATVIGNAATAFFYIHYFLRNKNTVLSISFKYFKPLSTPLMPIFIIGIPVSVNNMLMSFSNIVLNNVASRYGDAVIAGMGVSGRIFTIAIMIFVGLGQGVQPFIGYNFASGNIHRMNSAVTFTSTVSVIVGTVIMTFFTIFAPQAVAVFINNEEVIAYGTKILRAQMTPAPILGLLFVFMGAFQALGKGKQSLVLSLCRQGLAFIPVLFIGSALFGVDGVIWAQPIADIASVVLSAVLYISIYRKIITKHDAPHTE